ncbi:MAG: zinc ribbon domain-containing protein [Candidatus Thorarchaeota archaeon]
MTKKWILIAVIVGLLLPNAVSAATPTQSETYSPLLSVDVWISPLSWYAVYMTDLDEGDIIYIDIEETSGGGIDIIILDLENYNQYSNLNSYYYRARYLNRGSLSTSFSVPSSGTWYVVLQNDAILTSKHVEGSVGTSPSTNSILTVFIGLVIVISLICICIGICKKVNDDQEKKKKQSYQAPPPNVPLQTTDAAFCPYCGTQRQSYDAQFCSKCGRPFSGPEFE